MGEKQTLRKLLPYPGPNGLVSEGAQDIQELAEELDQMDENHTSFLIAGVTNLEDWSGFWELPTVNSATGEVKTPKAAGGVAWMEGSIKPKNVVQSDLTRVLLPKVIQSAVPDGLPSSGKYSRVQWRMEAEGGYALTTKWGKNAKITAHFVGEFSTQAAAESEISNPEQGDRYILGQFIMLNTAGVYSVVAIQQIAELAQSLGGTSGSAKFIPNARYGVVKTLEFNRLYFPGTGGTAGVIGPPKHALVCLTITAEPGAEGSFVTVSNTGGTVSVVNLTPSAEQADVACLALPCFRGDSLLVSTAPSGWKLEAVLLPI